MSLNDRFVVLAGTYQIARDFCTTHDLDERKMIYPSMTAMLLGLDGMPVYRAGRWQDMDPRTLDEAERVERWLQRAERVSAE